MLRNTREAIYGGLFSFIRTKAGSTFKTYSRIVKLWGDIPSDRRPALIFIEKPETYTQESSGRPGVIDLGVDILLIADAQPQVNLESSPPISVLNTLIDALETAIQPDFVTMKQTLGGLVEHAWIEGEVLKDSGDLDGTAVALIPVRMSVPS